MTISPRSTDWNFNTVIENVDSQSGLGLPNWQRTVSLDDILNQYEWTLLRPSLLSVHTCSNNFGAWKTCQQTASHFRMRGFRRKTKIYWLVESCCSLKVGSVKQNWAKDGLKPRRWFLNWAEFEKVFRFGNQFFVKLKSVPGDQAWNINPSPIDQTKMAPWLRKYFFAFNKLLFR